MIVRCASWQWTPSRRGAVLVVLPAVCVLDTATVAVGWWWAPIALAAVASFLCRGGRTFVALTAATVLASTAVLLWQAGSHVTAIAHLVGAIAFGASGTYWLVLAVTYLAALLGTAAGAWFGAAQRRLFTSRAPARTAVPHGEPDQPSQPASSKVLAQTSYHSAAADGPTTPEQASHAGTD